MQQRREMGGPGFGQSPAGGSQGGPSGGPQGGPGGRGRGRDFRSRRKVCAFCVDHVREIDYKDVARLRRYLSDRGKIEPRRKTGTCARHQRRLSVALKNARHMALMPYTASHIRGL
jgi:small subunit ribosomal protein S18